MFRHGRLRLYLLKLLDEAPRHGYEVIRLLQDRFLGVYAPSPGTIYPRLARLEEDGLVTHEEVDGKKIYSITDKGREEIRTRLGELADLEDELTESLRDVAREISEDVRDTVRSIREELASAARQFRGQESDRPESRDPGGQEQELTEAPGEHGRTDESRRIREEARRNREQMRANFRARGRSRGDWGVWQERISSQDWAAWTPWSDWQSGSAHPGAGWRGPGLGAKEGEPGGSDPRSRRGSPANPFSDIERIAIQFATELRTAAKQTGDIGERSLNDLRDILTDTLAKVRDEVFNATEPGSGRHEPGEAAGGGQAHPAEKASGQAHPAEEAGGSDEPGPGRPGQDQ